MELSEKGVSTNRGMIKRTFQKRGIEYAGELALQNLQDLYKVIEWNREKGIKIYRMSSCLFPWMSEYEFEELPQYEDILKICSKIGKFSLESGQRLSFHPGHFDILASPHEKVVNASILDLNRHAQIMDMMNLRTDHYNTINIHVGGAYGDKNEAMKRFCKNFKKLQKSAQQRLTVENDDKASLYTTQDLYEGIHKVIGIPVIFDYHHHWIHNEGMSEEEALKLASKTWPDGIRQLTHYSSAKKLYEDESTKVQSHAELIYEKINSHDLDFDIELEAKGKERALFKYLEDFC
jgi:UV DNA damage endonuclease